MNKTEEINALSNEGITSKRINPEQNNISLESNLKTLLDFKNSLLDDQKNDSVFAQSMDIGSFLASILDLEPQTYRLLEKEFLIGYRIMTNKKKIPYLSIILRNILALGFGFSHKNMLKNMLNKNYL